MVTPLENGFLPPALMSGQPLGGNKSNWNINSKMLNIFISFQDMTDDEINTIQMNLHLKLPLWSNSNVLSQSQDRMVVKFIHEPASLIVHNGVGSPSLNVMLLAFTLFQMASGNLFEQNS